MPKAPNYTDVNSAIIERCKKGERKAFHELYNLYVKAMFNVSLRILNNTAEAEEVLQDSFLKAFDKIEQYNPDYSFGVWLKRIVVNASLDVLKKRKPVFVPLDEIEYVPDNADSETENYWDSEGKTDFDIETVKRCMAELPDGYRTILSLYVFEDYTHKEIAEVLGISDGTSKSQYNRAKKKLMELVKHKQ